MDDPQAIRSLILEYEKDFFNAEFCRIRYDKFRTFE